MKSSIDIFPVLLGSRLRISTLNLLPHKMLSTALATFLITFHSCRFPWVNSIMVSNIGGPDRCCVTLENPDLFFFCNSFAVLSPTVAFSTPPISPFNAVFLTGNEYRKISQRNNLMFDHQRPLFCCQLHLHGLVPWSEHAELPWSLLDLPLPWNQLAAFLCLE